jgi:hypothetical protein
MIPQKQLFKHDPPNTYGDCQRTALAILLNKTPEEVPHFCEITKGKPDGVTSELIQSWLKERFLRLITITYSGTPKEVAKVVKNHAPDVYYCMSVVSPRGTQHVIVCLNDKVVCDPYTGGPVDFDCYMSNKNYHEAPEGLVWVDFLVPLEMTSLV